MIKLVSSIGEINRPYISSSEYNSTQSHNLFSKSHVADVVEIILIENNNWINSVYDHLI